MCLFMQDARKSEEIKKMLEVDKLFIYVCFFTPNICLFNFFLRFKFNYLNSYIYIYIYIYLFIYLFYGYYKDIW